MLDVIIEACIGVTNNWVQESEQSNYEEDIFLKILNIVIEEDILKYPSYQVILDCSDTIVEIFQGGEFDDDREEHQNTCTRIPKCSLCSTV